ncbi:Major Facilitator Superfamily protein [Asanoa hainanensis]|uniref:Major Facilitator Superfamily protein n=1 Tax=Asanoa hainanensis TaxID=560556 RepID=A0A239PAM8_9ACTN|nr:MFS transporter [Asanoa hainanensis]SNT64206.1 Major Facilitator Superfamily protein [Asanoa hainanensis]
MSTQSATYREVFAVPAFRVLFVSRSIAIAADALRIVALSVLVFAATGSPLLSAITFAIGFLPQVLGGALFGSLADRLRPRPLIVAGYGAECVAALTLATVPLPTWARLVLVAVVAVGTPVFNGASGRLVADVLTGDAYVLGRSVSSMASGGAQLLGLAAGGVAIAALGAQRALLLTAACHLVAALIVRFGLADLPAVPAADGGGAVRQSWSSNAALLADPWVRQLLLLQWLPSAFVVGAEALMVAYASTRGFPAGAVGLLMAASPLGMLVGHLVVGRLVPPDTRIRLVAPLVLLLGLPPVAFAFDPPLLVCAVLMTASGVGFAYSLGLQRAFVDAVPERGRGQAFGLLSTGLMTLQGVGPAVFGGLASLTAPRWAVALAGVTTVTTALLVPRRRFLLDSGAVNTGGRKESHDGQHTVERRGAHVPDLDPGPLEPAAGAGAAGDRRPLG